MNPREKTKMATLTATLGVFCLLLFHACFTMAQDTYKIQKASVVIAGTSTMHDWEMKGQSVTCSANFKMDGNKVAEVSGLQLTIPVSSLKSGKGAMDKNAYAALKADDHKQIVFAHSSSRIVGNKIISSGNLTIAGVTKPIEVESIYTVNADNTLSTKTTESFKMSEYKVEPPSFMFGSVTTGDAVTLTFDLTFKKN